MPSAAPSRCTEPGCGHYAVERGRCELHKRKAWASGSRNGAVLSGRDRVRFRRIVLARDPACRACGRAPSTEADHIVPVSAGGALHDPGNGQGLCHACHAAKTIAEREAARRARRPPTAH